MSAIPVISIVNCYFYYYISLVVVVVVVVVAILVLYIISSSMIIIIIVMCYPLDDINVQDIISSCYQNGFM